MPLALYPPGFNLSGFNIYNPATKVLTSGSSYKVSAVSAAQPLDAGTPMDSTNLGSRVATGFYRVFHIPDWLVSFNGYTFNGPTFIPVDYESPDAPTNYIADSTVLINGQTNDYATFMSENVGGYDYWGVGIYFDRLPNGTNTIQLLTKVRQSDTINDSTPFMVFSNAAQTIVIGNSVTFTNWDDLVWNNTNYTFRAQSGTSNVNWEIDIYDVNGNFVNSQTGYSPDGNISWTWDLTDSTGANRGNGDNDPDFYPEITLTQASGNVQQDSGVHPNTSGTPSPMPAVAAPYPSQGGWLVAYMNTFYSDGRTNDVSSWTADMTSGISAIAAASAQWPLPTKTFPIAYGRAYSQTNRDTSWNNLKSWLYYPQYRNFYYFGHGTADSIGSDYNTVDSSNNVTGGNYYANSKAYLTSKQVHDNVAFNPNGARPYRFAFLDGCDTANGSFAPAFGIPNQAHDGGWFASELNARNIRPCAFMGWNVEVGSGVNSGWGTVDGFWNFRKIWIGDWANETGEVLDYAVIVARDSSGWVPASQITSHLVTYGDTELLYLQYNYGGDWP